MKISKYLQSHIYIQDKVKIQIRENSVDHHNPEIQSTTFNKNVDI
jgi:hypothetical protein